MGETHSLAFKALGTSILAIYCLRQLKCIVLLADSTN